MDTTIFQTAELSIPGCYRTLHTYTMRPIMPFGARARFQEGSDVKVTNPVSLTIWLQNGYIVQNTNEGLTIFPPKPRVQEVFSKKSEGVYYHFHRGSITRHRGEETFHWSSEVQGAITHGVITFTHMCGESNVFDDDCLGLC
jgi:hypothetical protein